MNKVKIDSAYIKRMINHWLVTPVCGYLGSDYGSDLHALLQSPNGFGVADSFIAKMRKDLPILDTFSADRLSVVSIPVGEDEQFIEVRIDDTVAAYFSRNANGVYVNGNN